MKRLFIILLSILGVTSCLGTHYFEPEVGETSKTEDKISYLGDVCWFEVGYQQVLTKFQPGEAFKAFKYVIEIEGVESEEPTIVTKSDELAELTRKLKQEFPEFYERWYEENGGYPERSKAIIAFAIPENQTDAERNVEVKVSISKEYRDTENWDEWETVFSAIQNKYSVSE